MVDQRIVARKIASLATPTDDELAYFESLPRAEQHALLQAELDKGFAGEPIRRSLNDIVAEARARAEARRRTDG
jgi:hypothetical protein